MSKSLLLEHLIGTVDPVTGHRGGLLRTPPSFLKDKVRQLAAEYKQVLKTAGNPPNPNPDPNDTCVNESLTLTLTLNPKP